MKYYFSYELSYGANKINMEGYCYIPPLLEDGNWKQAYSPFVKSEIYKPFQGAF